jgi:hypothetical protein
MLNHALVTSCRPLNNICSLRCVHHRASVFVPSIDRSIDRSGSSSRCARWSASSKQRRFSWSSNYYERRNFRFATNAFCLFSYSRIRLSGGRGHRRRARKPTRSPYALPFRYRYRFSVSFSPDHFMVAFFAFSRCATCSMVLSKVDFLGAILPQLVNF